MSGQDTRKRIGRAGETMAARYLQKKGFRILFRNYRALGGEIDMIARDGSTLVFIEVKTKAHSGFGAPETWVNRKKQRQIGKIAQAYLHRRQLDDEDCRFDVIGVEWSGGEWRIHHITDAFWL
jgi:putative endonuclease